MEDVIVVSFYHFRKCKLTTSGPWIKLGSTPLLDVSFQVDPCKETGEVAVWAVAINGDVLFRTGVTEHCPTVNIFFLPLYVS